MNALRSISLILTASFALAACSTYQEKPTNTAGRQSSRTDKNLVIAKLYSQHEQWQGTKYKMGGLSRTGVDCSGFVYLTFRNQFGANLPRATDAQAKFGSEISLSQLQPGDLVFFKTSWKVRHVGIYVENNTFLHASTKNGVMLSRLDDYYWKDKIWQARRFPF